jgi:hypothetical protein
MVEQGKIQHLKNSEINFVKWDNCINNSHNGNIYAFSWYLDIICEEWEALVDDDYQSVMPLLITKKAGLPVTFTSSLATQLGVYSTDILSQEKVDYFVRRLAEIYQAFDINLNKFNQVDPGLFKQKKKSTFEFDIIGDYQTIKERYSPVVQSSIQYAGDQKVNIVKGLLPNDFLKFVSRKGVISSTKIRNNELVKLRRIIAFVMRHGLGEILAAYGPYNELIAAIFFLKSNRKINLLYSGVTKEGIQLKAMERILDNYIHRHAGQNLTLNFENLNIPDKEDFCKGFGGKKFHFTYIKNYSVPWYFKILLSFYR